MTESFKVARLKDIQLTLHQGRFIEKLDLGDAFFKCPFQSPQQELSWGHWERKLHQAFSFSFGSRILNGTPRTSCLAFELWQLETVNHHR